MSVLVDAAELVDGARQDAYGPPALNHGCTAALWQAYLDRRFADGPIALTARDVCWLNVLQKVSRDANEPARDNLVDVAGYVLNAERCDVVERAAVMEVVPESRKA